MLQPGNHMHPLGDRPWAADNGCFAKTFNETKWLRWLQTRQLYQSTCLFAVAPDVVGDASATLIRSTPFLPQIRALGYRPAYVAQDGWDQTRIHWTSFDCLFIGGTTEFKLERSQELTELGHQHDKWVHVGRVNSQRRFLAMASYEADSVDGTFLAFAPDYNTQRLLRWYATYDRQPSLF